MDKEVNAPSMGEIVEGSQKWPWVVRSSTGSHFLGEEMDFENVVYTLCNEWVWNVFNQA